MALDWRNLCHVSSDSQSVLAPYVLRCPRESLCPPGSFFLYIIILSHIDDLKKKKMC